MYNMNAPRRKDVAMVLVVLLLFVFYVEENSAWSLESTEPLERSLPAVACAAPDINKASLPESPPTIDLIPVAASSFIMGPCPEGDDARWHESSELPAHSVTLSAYRIGRFEVTNQQYAMTLNWALGKRKLKDAVGNAWAGSGDIFAGGPPVQLIVGITSPECLMEYVNGGFRCKNRVGLPMTTSYAMSAHPVVHISWYGALAFCNWLSEWQGMIPCYDLATWTLELAPPKPGGYRLPTEAEWERAAAWDGSKHWIYGFTSDTLETTDRDRCNKGIIYDFKETGSNPLGLTIEPFTTPVGWFNGSNISPNGNIRTKASVSPVGCYDMTGNVAEWVYDGDSQNYTIGDLPNRNDPLGTNKPFLDRRVVRGGSCKHSERIFCRTSRREGCYPELTFSILGFRLAKSD